MSSQPVAPELGAAPGGLAEVSANVSTSLNSTLTGLGAGSFSDRKDTVYNDLPGLGILFGMALSVVVIALIEFEIARNWRRLRYLYTPRCSLVKNPSPLPRRGFLKWLGITFSLSESWYLENVGLDAVMYLRFLRMALRTCTFVAIVVGTVLLPVNYLSRTRDGSCIGGLGSFLATSQDAEKPDLNLESPNSPPEKFSSGNNVGQFSIDNACQGSPILWVHALMTCVVSVTTMYQVYRESWAYMMLRRVYLVAKARQGAVHLRTVMVCQLPPELRDDQALKTYFERMGCGPVDTAKVVRNVGGLARKIVRRENILSQLELAHTQLARRLADEVRKEFRQREGRSGKLSKTVLSGTSRTARSSDLPTPSSPSALESASSTESTSTFSAATGAEGSPLDHLLFLSSSFPDTTSPPDARFPWDQIATIDRSAVDRFQPPRQVPIVRNVVQRVLDRLSISTKDDDTCSDEGEEDSCEENRQTGPLSRRKIWDGSRRRKVGSLAPSRPLIDNLVLKYHYLDRRVRDLRRRALEAEPSSGPSPSQASARYRYPDTDPIPKMPLDAHRPSFSSTFVMRISKRTQYDTGQLFDHSSPLNESISPAENTVRRRNRHPLFRPTSVGFVTFRSHVSAALAAQAIVCGTPHFCTTSMAPEPRDINWDNLVRSNSSSPRILFRRAAASMASWAVTVLWILPSSYIYTLTVGELVSAKGLLGSGSNRYLANLVMSSLPTLLTSMQQVIMPHIFWAITALECLPTYSDLEENVLKRYYRWAFINIFVLFMFARVIGVALIVGFQNPAQIVLLLARYLPEGATFFINFVLFCTCLHSLELLQLGAPLLSAFFVTSTWVSKSPRQLYKNTFPLSFPYYYFYPNHTLIFCLTIIYATVNPLVLFAGSIYFAFANVVFRYQFAFAYVRKYEKAGRLWMQMVRHVIGGLLLFQLMMVGLMLLKSSYAPLVLLIPLFVATVCFRLHWTRTFVKRTKFMSLDTGLHVALDRTETKMDSAAEEDDSDVNIGKAKASASSSPIAIEKQTPWDNGTGVREEWGRRIIKAAEALEVREAEKVAASGLAGLTFPTISKRASPASAFGWSRAVSESEASSAAALQTHASEAASPPSGSGDCVSPDDEGSNRKLASKDDGEDSLDTQVNADRGGHRRTESRTLAFLAGLFPFFEDIGTSPQLDAKPAVPAPPKDPHLIQDEDSTNQTYTHPCLIEPLPTRLWLPLNPLNPKMDLEHTTQLGKAIVSSKTLKGSRHARPDDKLRKESAAERPKRKWRQNRVDEGVLATSIGTIAIALGMEFGGEAPEGFLMSRSSVGEKTSANSRRSDCDRQSSPFESERCKSVSIHRRHHSGSSVVLSPSPSPPSIRRLPSEFAADASSLRPARSCDVSPRRQQPPTVDTLFWSGYYSSAAAGKDAAATLGVDSIPNVDRLEGGGRTPSRLFLAGLAIEDRDWLSSGESDAEEEVG